jgi:hypothetical protein
VACKKVSLPNKTVSASESSQQLVSQLKSINVINTIHKGGAKHKYQKAFADVGGALVGAVEWSWAGPIAATIGGVVTGGLASGAVMIKNPSSPSYNQTWQVDASFNNNNPYEQVGIRHNNLMIYLINNNDVNANTSTEDIISISNSFLKNNYYTNENSNEFDNIAYSSNVSSTKINEIIADGNNSDWVNIYHNKINEAYNSSKISENTKNILNIFLDNILVYNQNTEVSSYCNQFLDYINSSQNVLNDSEKALICTEVTITKYSFTLNNSN